MQPIKFGEIHDTAMGGEVVKPPSVSVLDPSVEMVEDFVVVEGVASAAIVIGDSARLYLLGVLFAHVWREVCKMFGQEENERCSVICVNRCELSL